MKRYKSIEVDYGVNTELMESFSQKELDEEVENFEELGDMENIAEGDFTGASIRDFDDLNGELDDLSFE